MLWKSKKEIRIVVTAMICMVMTAGLLPVESAAAVQYMPDVTADMSHADYWAQKVSNPDQVLVATEEIEQLNREIWEKSRETRDLANWPETQYDAAACVRGLLRSAGEDQYDEQGSLISYCDAHYCYSVYGAKYDKDGKVVEDWQELYADRIANCRDSSVDIESAQPVMQDYKFAVCTARTELLILPTEDWLLDAENNADPDFDVNYLSVLRVNEPLILKTKSADGKFYAAMSSCCSGWVRASDVAICADKEEWLAAWNYPSDQLLVVYDDKIYTEDSRYQPETANRKLPMGTCLQLATEEESQGRISNRTAHNNHVVWMPVRREDGTYEKKLALIGENRKVSEGYLPVTARNIAKVALNQLGDAYGWGGMMGTNDCSGYVRDVYRCFGIDMPRSSNRNNGVMKSFDLSAMSDAEKASFIKHLPPGAQLAFSGHEMLYLGYEGDKLYVISSVSNVRMPGDNYNTRVRGGVINTLDILRGNDTSWLHNLNYAAVPYYLTEHADPLVIKGRSVTVSAAKLKKMNLKIKATRAFRISGAQGSVTYQKDSVNKKKYAKKFTVNRTNGDITIKKGVKKGNYKLKVNVTAVGNYRYEPETKTVTVTIRVQ